MAAYSREIAENNYYHANKFVKDVEIRVNSTSVAENKSHDLFAVSDAMKNKIESLSKKYEVPQDTVLKNVLDRWKAISESREKLKTDCPDINKEAMEIEERFEKVEKSLV